MQLEADIDELNRIALDKSINSISAKNRSFIEASKHISGELTPEEAVAYR